METKAPVKMTLLKQSSMAPDRERKKAELNGGEDDGEGIEPGVRLMYSANERDLEGIKELLDSGIDVNYHDIDNRTALHVAACQGFTEVVSLLLERGAAVDSKDRWGSTVSSNEIWKLLFLLCVLVVCTGNYLLRKLFDKLCWLNSLLQMLYITEITM